MVSVLSSKDEHLYQDITQVVSVKDTAVQVIDLS